MKTLFSIRGMLGVFLIIVIIFLAIGEMNARKKKQAINEAGLEEIQRRSRENFKYVGGAYSMKNPPPPSKLATAATAPRAQPTASTNGADVAIGSSAPEKPMEFVSKFPRKTLYVVTEEGLALRLALDEAVSAEEVERVRSALTNSCLSPGAAKPDAAACPKFVNATFNCDLPIVRPPATPGLGVQALDKPMIVTLAPAVAPAVKEQLAFEALPTAGKKRLGEVTEAIWTEGRCPTAPAIFHARAVHFVER